MERRIDMSTVQQYFMKDGTDGLRRHDFKALLFKTA